MSNLQKNVIFQSDDLGLAISDDLPMTPRRPTDDLPMTYPPYYPYGVNRGTPTAGASGVPSMMGEAR